MERGYLYPGRDTLMLQGRAGSCHDRSISYMADRHGAIYLTLPGQTLEDPVTVWGPTSRGGNLPHTLKSEAFSK